MQGVIVTYVRKKSFGWILPDDESISELFFHRTAVADGLRVKDDMRVEFDLGEHAGRPCAINVRLSSEGALIAPVVGERTDERK